MPGLKIVKISTKINNSKEFTFPLVLWASTLEVVSELLFVEPTDSLMWELCLPDKKDISLNNKIL